MLEGRQVAVLCPTTVLARLSNVFSERFRRFREGRDAPVRSPPSKGDSGWAKARNIDVIIGTHRLLSKDVEFKDLGLIVVDEEQRFGVTHRSASSDPPQRGCAHTHGDAHSQDPAYALSGFGI